MWSEIFHGRFVAAEATRVFPRGVFRVAAHGETSPRVSSLDRRNLKNTLRTLKILEFQSFQTWGSISLFGNEGMEPEMKPGLLSSLSRLN